MNDVKCGDACGAVLPSEDAAMQSGWSWLSVLNRYRCGACYRALTNVVASRESDPTPDTLPPGSIGALRKETASSIAAPAVMA